MVRKGFVIDTQKFQIIKDVEYDDKVFDGLYVKDVNAPAKEGANILFAAQTFPEECRSQVEKALKELKEAKENWEKVQSRIYYKTFRAIRDGEKVYP